VFHNLFLTLYSNFRNRKFIVKQSLKIQNTIFLTQLKPIWHFFELGSAELGHGGDRGDEGDGGDEEEEEQGSGGAEERRSRGGQGRISS
jgi:hypothetical protein